MKRSFLFLLLVLPFLAIIFSTACGKRSGKALQTGSNSSPFEESWESLSRHEAAPEWFRDAKFGIYFHWGVYSVPAFWNEWYPHWMFFKGHPVYEHHLATYGPPSEFGYQDFIPMFRAEKFNAEEWADLFVKAGARFAGPVAEHHDGFSMWDSKATPWNAMDMGPKRDITGELEKAIKARGMKFITTFHNAKQLQRYDSLPVDENGYGYWYSSYPYIKGMPTASDDPKLQYLYGNMPEAKWLKEIWLPKLKEVVDQYRPDIMWFDYCLDLIPDTIRQEYCAYYLNRAEQWNKDVVIVRKQEDLPISFSVEDLEKSRKNTIGSVPWMTDETVSTGSWCYTRDLKIKDAKDVLHVLIDIVSKNGVLLLNISPKADGTIPADQQKVLLAIGAWLDRYGEAIYGTRPWYTFGEGPTVQPAGDFKYHREFLKIRYSAEDIRYTTKEGNIYACMLGSPAAGMRVLLRSFSPGKGGGIGEIRKVSLLGDGNQLDWKITDEGLSVLMPGTGLDSMAVVLKIEARR
jgi:alpha-L-fucosidase